jgi:hypothetical protein
MNIRVDLQENPRKNHKMI